MYEYYLKKCRRQELGSVDSDGKTQRGRYLLTSKDVLSFFPPLTQTQLNDSALLPIIPLYSGKKIYCNYVYHNDKYHGSQAKNPRDEYRIYLNKELEENTLLFKENDIVIFRQENIVENEIMQTVYLMDLVREDNSSYYKKLNAIIENSPLREGYGLYCGNIFDFEANVSESIFSRVPILIDQSVTKKIISNSADAIAKLFNEVSFRDFVMTGYDNLCAITGTAINYRSFTNLEAAHIKPKSHGGLFLPNNGIALSRDLHWAFDKGFFTLDNDFRVKIHPEITSEYLRKYDRQQIRIPSDTFFAPNLDNVRYHQENVYGLFLKSGRL